MADNPPASGSDADTNFMGFASRLDPGSLKPSILHEALNVRLQRGTAQPRKGTQRLTDASLNSLTMVGSGEYVDATGKDSFILVFTDRIYVYTPAQNGDAAVLSVSHAFPTGRTIASGGVCSVLQALNKVYIFRGMVAESTKATATTNSSIPHFATGTITITTTGNHGYSTGDEVTMRFVTHAVLNQSYIVTVTGANTFTFQWTNTTGSTFSSNTAFPDGVCVKCKPALVWDGTSSALTVASQAVTTGGSAGIPCADFAFYFQNRIICNNSPTTMAVGDILSEVFDLTLNNFTINLGGNDSIVGVLPWIESQFLVFMKKSILMAYVEPSGYAVGDSPGINSTITVVSTEVGAISRKSIIAAGQFVLFLSGKGIHLLTPQLDLKVIGNTLPLSESIADFFDAVNFAHASKATSCYYNNRFYIAIATGESTRNNSIIVFNTLNKEWESIDTYPIGLYADDMFVAAYGSQKRMYILTRFAGAGQYGGVFLTEEREDGDMYTGATGIPLLPFYLPFTLLSSAPQTSPINSSVTTREYTLGTSNEKRFSSSELQFNNAEGDIVGITVYGIDPDSEEEVLRYTFEGDTDGTLRPRLGIRGSAVQAKVDFITGRPSLKGVAVYAMMANRAMVSQE